MFRPEDMQVFCIWNAEKHLDQENLYHNNLAKWTVFPKKKDVSKYNNFSGNLTNPI